MANLGYNPTVSSDKTIKFEVHVLNRNDLDLYEKEVYFIFNKFIRDEMKFSSVDELIKQISNDCETAKKQLLEY